MNSQEQLQGNEPLSAMQRVLESRKSAFELLEQQYYENVQSPIFPVGFGTSLDNIYQNNNQTGRQLDSRNSEI